MSKIIPPFAIHERLRLLRQFAGLTEAALSKIMKCTSAHVLKVEAGKSDILAEELSRLRNYFQISSDVLLDGPIPYFQVSVDFNKGEILSPKFSDGITRPIACLSPLIELLQNANEGKIFELALKQNKINSFLFADSEVAVNQQFIRSVLESKSLVAYFEKDTNFKKLKAQLIKIADSDQRTGLQEATGYHPSLINAWTSLIFVSGKSYLSPKATRAFSRASDLNL